MSGSNLFSPKVSVLVMTHNHERFIQQALDSVLIQEVDFEYEILISEDCSTDHTREIVLEFRKDHPHETRLLLSEKNLHNNEIVSRGLRAARGQYIALLDGDDYWTSSHKLQKQVEFLDIHPECTICFHNARVVSEEGMAEESNWTPPDQKKISTIEDMWLGNFIATCSTMYRSGSIGEIPDWYADLFPITDWPLHLLHAEKGSIGYIDEVMGVYRYHSGGLYSTYSETQKQEQTLKFFLKMNRNFNFHYSKIVQSAISKYFIEWAEEYLHRGDLDQARKCFRTGLAGRPLNRYISLPRLAGLGLRIYIPVSSNFRRNRSRTRRI